MAVIKGDRVAESAKLNRCSKRAHEAYSYYIATLADDFGRFRFSAKHALVALFPRRSDVTEREVKAVLAEYEKHGLLKTWEQDGATFAEWRDFEVRSRRFHRAPEPPWSTHEHSTRCEKTGRVMEHRWRSSRVLPSPPSSPSAPSPPSTSGKPANAVQRACVRKPAGNAPGNGHRPPATPARPASEIDHDPTNPDHVELVAECEAIADETARAEDRERAFGDALEILRALSTTPSGTYLDGLTQASAEWITQTLHTVARFRAENGLSERAPPATGRST